MLVDRSRFFQGLALALAIGLCWLVFEFSPDRQLDKAMDRLITAAEDRDFDRLRQLMAADYRDQWTMDREQALSAASEVLRQFLTLQITTENPSGTRHGREAELSMRLRLAGRGTAIGEMILQRANELEDDFRFAWRRKSWKPWDWKLVSVSQNEIVTEQLP